MSPVEPFSPLTSLAIQNTSAGDQLQLQVTLPRDFGTAAMPFPEMAYLRLWVEAADMGDQLVWNDGGYVSIQGNTATLKVSGVPRGSYRLVFAQAYKADKTPIPGARLSAWYHSPPGEQQVTLNIKWSHTPVVNVLKWLKDSGSPWAVQVDAARLQRLMDALIYGPAGGSTYQLHPSRINYQAIGQYLMQSNGNVPAAADLPPTWRIKDNTATFTLRDLQGQPYQIGNVLLTISDPASLPVTLPQGQETATLANLAPGTWEAVVNPTANPALQIRTTVTVGPDGAVTIAQPMPWSFPNGPTVTSLNVIQGVNVADTAVTLTGTGFKAGATVKIGTLAATGVNVTSATTLNATVPQGLASGVYPVAVINPDPLSGTKINAFTALSGLTTVAGTGAPGYNGENILAATAQLNLPGCVSLDNQGNLLIIDTNRVRAVAAATGTFYGQAMTAGRIYTIVGNGTANAYNPADEGAVPTAVSTSVGDVFVDGNGHLFIADDGKSRIRLIPAANGTYFGQAMLANRIYTIAGDGSTVYNVADEGDSPLTTGFNRPTGIYVSPAGHVVIADYLHHRIRMIPAATGTFYGQAMNAGKIYTIGGNGIAGSTGDNGPATAARLNRPSDVYLDSQQNVLITDYNNGLVRKIAPNGTISLFAGSSPLAWTYSGAGGLATAVGLSGPWQLHVDGADRVFVADLWNHAIRRIDPNGQMVTVAGDAFDASGKDDGDWFGRFNGDNQAATAASMDRPSGVVVSPQGVLYIGDYGLERVRKVIL